MISISSLPIQFKHSSEYLFGTSKFSVDLEGDTFFVRPRSYDPYVLGEVYKEKVYQIKNNVKCRSVLDLGAYIGDYTIWSITHMNAQKVVAVEMDNENFRLLSKNIQINNLGKKIVAINAAVSSGNGQIGEFENKFNSGMHRANFAKTGKTMSVSLDKIMKMSGLEKIDLVKMDIEGGEKEIFVNKNKKIFAKKVGCIIMETHPRLFPEKSIVDYLSGLGYSVSMRRQAFRRGGILTAYNKRYE